MKCLLCDKGPEAGPMVYRETDDVAERFRHIPTQPVHLSHLPNVGQIDPRRKVGTR